MKDLEMATILTFLPRGGRISVFPALNLSSLCLNQWDKPK